MLDYQQIKKNNGVIKRVREFDFKRFIKCY